MRSRRSVRSSMQVRVPIEVSQAARIARLGMMEPEVANQLQTTIGPSGNQGPFLVSSSHYFHPGEMSNSVVSRGAQVDNSSKVRKYIAPATAASILLVEVLIGLADVRRPLFLAVSLAAVLLTLGLTGWYASTKEVGRAIASGAACVLVLLLAWAGAPSSTSAQTGSVVGQVGDLQPEDESSYDSRMDDVVVEEPSEAEVIFRPLSTPWYNDIKDMFSSATVQDAEGEAAVMGAWWAAGDWCKLQGHGSEGRCYDLAALSLGQTFDRDPRTFNAENWYGAGAVASLTITAYETTAEYLSFEPQSSLIPEIFRDRPGLDWFCEPTCVAGAAKR